MVIAVLVVAALVLLLLLAGGFLFARMQKENGMFFPDRYPAGRYERQYEPQPRDVWFTTPDGVKLHGWVFAAAGVEAPLLIWFHGNGGNLSLRGDTAAEMARRGITVFLFDYRGYGLSEGKPSEAALHVDSLAAYEFAVKAIPGSSAPVLYGESLGGPYAARVARLRGSSSVVIENSFPSLTEVGNTIYGWPLGLFVRGSLRTADDLNAAGVPVLVMHSQADQVLPYRLGESLFRQLRTEKELYVSHRADHSMIPEEDGDRFYDAVTRFIQRHQKKEKAPIATP